MNRQQFLRGGGALALCIGLFLVAAGFAWLWSSRDQTPAGFEGAIDALVMPALSDGSISGVSVAVARNGRTVFAKGYGFADLENDLLATPETICWARLARMSATGNSTPTGD